MRAWVHQTLEERLIPNPPLYSVHISKYFNFPTLGNLAQIPLAEMYSSIEKPPPPPLFSQMGRVGKKRN